jgi:hypothetical protein
MALRSERQKVLGDLLFFKIIGNLFKYKLDARLRGHDGVERCHSRGSGNYIQSYNNLIPFQGLNQYRPLWSRILYLPASPNYTKVLTIKRTMDYKGLE